MGYNAGDYSAQSQSPDFDYNQYASMNRGFENSTALQIRLNTEPILRQLELFFSGKKEIVIIEDGEQKLKIMNTGKPLLNDVGLQNIMSLLEGVFNAQIAQGNFEQTENYETYLVRFRTDLARELMINLTKWGVNRHDYGTIITRIMRPLEVFLTRPIGNKERDSFSSTIKTIESTKTEPQKQSFNMPFLGR